MSQKIKTWLSVQWFPIGVVIVGFVHMIYTIGGIKEEFRVVQQRLSYLESQTSILPALSVQVTNAETWRTEFRNEFSRFVTKQEEMDGKLNRILGYMDHDRKIAARSE